MDRQVVIKTEQGLYSSPSSAIVEVLFEGTGIDHATIVGEYDAWVLLKRRTAARAVREGQLAVQFNNSQLAPVGIFFNAAFPNSSQIGRAKGLCIHPSTLKQWEEYRQAWMPAQIRVALLAADLTVSEVEYINSKQALWWAIYRG